MGGSMMLTLGGTAVGLAAAVSQMILIMRARRDVAAANGTGWDRLARRWLLRMLLVADVAIAIMLLMGYSVLSPMPGFMPNGLIGLGIMGGVVVLFQPLAFVGWRWYARLLLGGPDASREGGSGS